MDFAPMGPLSSRLRCLAQGGGQTLQSRVRGQGPQICVTGRGKIGMGTVDGRIPSQLKPLLIPLFVCTGESSFFRAGFRPPTVCE